MSNIEKPKILIVDDREENLLALDSVLSEIPSIEVLKAVSGKDALWLVLQHEFALIILDVQMPGMDGFELASIIKERDKSRDIPIIFVTAISKEKEYVFRGYETGCIDYIFKPFEPEILKSKVRIFIEMYRQKFLISNQANALKESEEIFRGISSSAQDGIVLINRDSLISYFNNAAEKMFGYQSHEVLGKNPSVLIPSNYYDTFSDYLNKLRTKGDEPSKGRLLEVNAKRKDGTEFHIEVSVSKLEIRGEWGAVFMIRDIEERKLVQLELERLANFDMLTGLPNRNMFMHSFTKIISLAKRNNYMVGLLFIDLDDFKIVNDTYGHDVGDIIIKQAGERLKNCIRTSDFLIRMGGDEFLIILSKVREENDIVVVTERINKAFEEPFKERGEFCLGASIGISICPYNGSDPDMLLSYADMAMYHSKDTKRNSYKFYSDEIDIRVQNKLEIENSIRNAIKNDEFFVNYQLLVDINSMQAIGMEALVRWKHPKRGIVPPYEFISIAEEFGQIMKIDELVIRKGCVDFMEMQKGHNRPLRLAVNLSALWFRQHAQIDIITNIINELSFDPKCFELEITEGVFMTDLDEKIKIFKGLRDLGIHVAIDDFGTGYSSMSYLMHLPVDKIKIDRAFIKNMEFNEIDRSVVKAIITLAHSMKLQVVAEGVETMTQLDILKNLNCDQMQGFLYHKPAPLKDVIPVLLNPPKLI